MTIAETKQDESGLLCSLLAKISGSRYPCENINEKDTKIYTRDELRHTADLADPRLMILREACTCEKCVDPTDHQRYFVWADIPTDISVARCDVDCNGDYVITWQNDIQGYADHVSCYARSEIEHLGGERTRLSSEAGRRSKRLWRASTFDISESTVSYQEYMNDDTALARLLNFVARDGLAFINGIPGEKDSVNKMAERVGPLRTTFYGETWDVKSEPNATNVAYTSRYLGFHMDMLYVREPPGLQFLHCIENTCKGGESRFADTFSAADRLISKDGEAVFTALESMKITYHYRRPGISASAIKPVFDVTGHESKPRNNFTNANHPDLINKLHRVYWSPPFTGRALGNGEPDDVVSQLRASKSFHEILEDEDSFIRTKVPEGTCAVFDNFRVVHAREAFDINNGNRWLRVAYVDDSDFQSRVLTLESQLRFTTGA